MKKNDIKAPLFCIGISALIVMAEVLRELHSFCIRKYEIKTDKVKDQIRLVFLSDLHGKVYGKNNHKLLQAVKKQKPDIILVGGDMLTRSKEASDVTAYQCLKELVKIAPVYCSNGNHEQKMREYPETYGERYHEYIDALKRAGVHVLENNSEYLEYKDTKLRITGLEVPVGCYTHFKRAPLSQEDIESRIGKSGGNAYEILMAHTPVYAKEYQKWGADLTLSGHLHGGIIRLPFVGGIITPQVELFPRYSGDMYKDGEQYIVVSRGLGTHTVNLRYWNMAELVSIVLNPTEESLS